MLDHQETGLQTSGRLIFLRSIWPDFLKKFDLFSQAVTATYLGISASLDASPARGTCSACIKRR